MPSLTDRYDAAFLGILQYEGKIQPFIDAVFSFLYRRTDFYRIMKSPDDKMGFPPGVAAQLVKEHFLKYETMAKRDQEKQQKLEEAALKKQEEEMKLASIVAQEEEVGTTESQEGNKPQNGGQNIKADDKTNKCDTNKTNTTDQQTKPKDNKDAKPKDSGNTSASKSSDNSLIPSSDSKSDKSQGDTNKEDETEQERKQKIYQSNPSSYNGAIRDRYCWSQSITDVDVTIPIPKYIKKGKDVSITIQKKHLKVSVKNSEGVLETYIDQDLTWDVNKEECIWNLSPGENIIINLEKNKERWWEGLLVGEEKINVQKIDPSRPMADLDDEAQAKIAEMMYNERQKALGLPQSHEQKVHDMLKKGWDAEGSPFRGQPFDPSIIDVASGSGAINPPPS